MTADAARRAASDQPAIAPFTTLIVGNGVQQIRSLEIWPQLVSHVYLGVGNLPKKKIAHSQLAAGADYEIGIR